MSSSSDKAGLHSAAEINSLVSAIQQNDTASFVKLLGIFSPAISSSARSFSFLQSEYDDLCQEGRMALYRAAVSYKIGESQFNTYANVCIHNSMNTWAKRSASARFSGTTLSLDQTAEDVAVDKTELSCETAAKDLLERILNGSETGLSQYEQKVLGYSIAGSPVKEIAAMLGKKEKSVENTLFRARAKIKKYMNR